MVVHISSLVVFERFSVIFSHVLESEKAFLLLFSAAEEDFLGTAWRHEWLLMFLHDFEAVLVCCSLHLLHQIIEGNALAVLKQDHLVRRVVSLHLLTCLFLFILHPVYNLLVLVA